MKSGIAAMENGTDVSQTIESKTPSWFSNPQVSKNLSM
jgi:hypothetical protein